MNAKELKTLRDTLSNTSIPKDSIIWSSEKTIKQISDLKQTKDNHVEEREDD